jgi:hypothetical protein
MVRPTNPSSTSAAPASSAAPPRWPSRLPKAAAVSKLDDTLWKVTGPDLPVGARVKVVASNGRDLTVEQA